MALRNRIFLDVKFPLALYMKLKGLQVGMPQLEEYDSETAENLKSVLTCDGDVEEDLKLTYEYNMKPLIKKWREYKCYKC
jgi:hypothetical protein